MNFLPRKISKVMVPPIKCQGIKTKLVNFISESIKWNNKGKWIEPFLGSGVVLFNIQPERALVSDTNIHIIQFYNDIQSGKIDENIVRYFLEEIGEVLSKRGEDFYYEMREKFNKEGGSLLLLFLNRSCFNGIMRFNSKGKFNVPFGHKPERFRKSYITKICNQVRWIRTTLKNKDWIFEVSNWKETILKAEKDDFIYMDPPYIGRHTDYYNKWTEDDAIELSKIAQSLNCGFALSMWFENKYRRNYHIYEYWPNCVVKTFKHFYHVGSTENFRNEMKEALVIKHGFAAEEEIFKKKEHYLKTHTQMDLFLESR